MKTNCPAGTFGASTGLHNVTECTPCTPGSYCNIDGESDPSFIPDPEVIKLFSISPQMSMKF